MNDIQWLTELLAGWLTGNGVFIASIVLTIVFFVFYYKNKSRQLLNSLPGLFTSLGLLGTFVAICNSLGDIDQDTLEIDAIIRDLIPAFTSSIAGLVAAFFVTIICKILYAIEDRQLDEKVKMKSPEECLYNLSEIINENLPEISKQLTEQADKNRKYNDRLNTTISQQSRILEQFINHFVKRMDGIFTKMQGRIEQNIRAFGEEQFGKCADTLEVLTERMSSLSNGLLEEQKSNVQQMIAGTNSELRSVSNHVTEQITALCKQMTSALETLHSNQDRGLTSILENYIALSERLVNQNSNFAERMNAQMNAEYEKLQEQSVNSLRQMVDLKEAYAEVNKEMFQNSTSMNREVSTELRNSLSSFVTDLQKTVMDEMNVLRTAIAASVESLESSYAYISEHMANIKGNYESAAHAYIDAVNTAHRMNESQEKMLTTINNSMKHVVDTNDKIDQVITVMEDRQERIENLISHINEISTTIEVLQQLESQLNRIVNK